jgi:ATP-dependent Clp protease protease subunit
MLGDLYPRTQELKSEKGAVEALVSGEHMVDVAEHLANKHRVLFLSGVIGGSLDLVMGLLAMDSVSHDPIKLVITSPGGDVEGTLLLYDTLQSLQSPIYTFGRYCASAAVMILVAGEKRYLSPHALTMLHLISATIGGDTRDVEIQYKELDRYKDKMLKVLLDNGATKSKEQILIDIDRDFYLSPQQAIDYGLADEIMTKEVMKGWLDE